MNKARRDHGLLLWAIFIRASCSSQAGSRTSHHNTILHQPMSPHVLTGGCDCGCHGGASARHHRPRLTTGLCVSSGGRPHLQWWQRRWSGGRPPDKPARPCRHSREPLLSGGWTSIRCSGAVRASTSHPDRAGSTGAGTSVSPHGSSTAPSWSGPSYTSISGWSGSSTSSGHGPSGTLSTTGWSGASTAPDPLPSPCFNRRA